jgi:hypothetical protein
MCDMDQSGCTMSETLNVVDKYSTPIVGPSDGPVEGRNVLLGNNPIYHSVDRVNFTVTNTALEGHDYYPGTVVHSLSIDVRSRWSWSNFSFQSVDAIFLTTVGTGTGANPGWNNFLGRELFQFTHAWSQNEMQRRARKGR